MVLTLRKVNFNAFECPIVFGKLGRQVVVRFLALKLSKKIEVFQVLPIWWAAK
jgi:hypothetical protein